MSNKKTLLDLVEKLRDWFWFFALERKYSDEFDIDNETLSTKFLLLIYDLFFDNLYNVVWFLSRRLPCLLFGCKIDYSIPFNVPEGLYEQECLRCGAYKEIDGYEFNHKIIYDNILIRLNEKIPWEKILKRR